MLIHLVARRAAVAFLLVALTAGKASAQFDFVGSWAPLGTEDVQNDSVPVDYLGLALTDEARTRALSYDESQKSMIERQCAGWGAAYMVLGPFGLRVTSQTDPVTNRVVSFTIAAVGRLERDGHLDGWPPTAVRHTRSTRRPALRWAAGKAARSPRGPRT